MEAREGPTGDHSNPQAHKARGEVRRLGCGSCFRTDPIGTQHRQSPRDGDKSVADPGNEAQGGLYQGDHLESHRRAAKDLRCRQ